MILYDMSRYAPLGMGIGYGKIITYVALLVLLPDEGQFLQYTSM